MTIQFEQEQKSTFEVVLHTRDKDGNSTGTKSFATDSPYKLEQFWLRNSVKTPKKKKIEKVAKDSQVAAASLVGLEHGLGDKLKQSFKDNKLTAVVDLTERPDIEVMQPDIQE